LYADLVNVSGGLAAIVGERKIYNMARKSSDTRAFLLLPLLRARRQQSSNGQ